MLVPLSPSAQLLLKILDHGGRAQTADELKKSFEGQGEPPSLVTSALAECMLQRKVRKVAAWKGSTAPTYYELDSAGVRPPS